MPTDKEKPAGVFAAPAGSYHTNPHLEAVNLEAVKLIQPLYNPATAGTTPAITYNDVILALEARGRLSQENASGWRNGRCPAHDDRTASFGVVLVGDNGFAFHCFAGCERDAILDALGLGNGWQRPAGPPPLPKPKAKRTPKPPAVRPTPPQPHFLYRDAAGKPLLAVHRRDLPDGSKRFTQWTPCPGGWQSVGIVGQQPLYRLDRLRAEDTRVIVVEGEKGGR